jgi:hypothetical protein
MNMAGKAYVVRDAGSDIPSGDVTQVYAYTLKGLTTALEDARLRSFGGIPQEVAVITDGKSTVIRRFDHGREVPDTPLPHSTPTRHQRLITLISPCSARSTSSTPRAVVTSLAPSARYAASTSSTSPAGNRPPSSARIAR